MLSQKIVLKFWITIFSLFNMENCLPSSLVSISQKAKWGRRQLVKMSTNPEPANNPSMCKLTSNARRWSEMGLQILIMKEGTLGFVPARGLYIHGCHLCLSVNVMENELCMRQFSTFCGSNILSESLFHDMVYSIATTWILSINLCVWEGTLH